MAWTLEDLIARERRQEAARARKAAGALQPAQEAPATTEAVKSAPEPKRLRRAARQSYNPKVLNAWLASYGIPAPCYEFRFCPERRFRFDLAWPGVAKLAIEVQGGNFSGGRHVRPSALQDEYEKLTLAASLGWRVMLCTPERLQKAEMAKLIVDGLKWHGPCQP